MAITHFSITLPDPNLVDTLIDGSPVVENQQYPIAQQNLLTFSRVALLEGFSISVPFTYKVYDVPNNRESNTANMNVSWFGRVGLPAVSANSRTESIAKSAQIRLIDAITINEATEHINITAITGVPNWKLNGAKLYVGQKLTVAELYYAIFTANDNGGGFPYAEIQFSAGNRNETTAKTDYASTINVDTDVELQKQVDIYDFNYSDEFEDPSTVTYNVIEQVLVVDITEGLQGGTAEVQIIINSPYLALNSFNKVIIDDGSGIEIEKTADETFNISVSLDLYGKGTFSIKNYIVEDTADPKTGQIDVELLNVDGNTSVVSPTTYQEQMITNFV